MDLVRTEEEPVLPSREQLDSAYPTFLDIPDPDEKARTLSELGSLYHILYEESRRMADLEKAISVHEEAVQLTSGTHPQLAEHLESLGIALQEKI